MTEQPRPTWGEYYHAVASQMALYAYSNQALAEAAGLQPGMTVIDLASGSGLTSLAALQAVPEGLRLVLVDSSPSMIEAARSRLGDRAEAYHVADAAALSSLVEARKVDRVLCNLAFFSFRDPEAVLREVRKVLKPTGAILFTLANTHFNTGGGVVSPQWALMRHLHEQGLLPRGVHDVERLPNQRAMEGTLQGAGFKPFLYKMVEIPEQAGAGDLAGQLRLYPLFGGDDGVQRSLEALQASDEAVAAWQPRWRVVLFAAQPQLTAEEAFLMRFGGKMPGQP